MRRTAWLQDRRMQRDGLSRRQGGGLSMMKAGELLGVSEQKFRRFRRPFNDVSASRLAVEQRSLTLVTSASGASFRTAGA
ncbi:hypothetical protein CO661_01665 [Sinorhizobium fredii]|uniref:Uncharacterized protein n=1 Tax=Rhizobium fredii TaxID=380 RepID=A0A2A6M6U3_RHIFR|nr:hypothetical protein CO661_01665 [Sinorhizobium fredii]